MKTTETLRSKYVRNLPWFAQVNAVPREWKFWGALTLAPLWAGAMAVHAVSPVLTSDSDTSDPARRVMTYTIHYACALTAGVSALHWGLEAVKFGLPKHTTEFFPLFRFMRFGLPVVPLTVAILASRMSVENPRLASVVLMSTVAAGTAVDFFSYTFATSPVWFPRFQLFWTVNVIAALFVLMTSERMLIRGEIAGIDTT